ncbi:Glycosyltransferase sugar-binding region containing DXD motif-containing protein [Pseudobutyrivibrio sp. OR37]|uniref:glycosyltransferase family 32 protein n=1 Tax=Pseudobutyrivibrio sp. OR37 TaxID=1798186 RepID=UPI0008DFB120|nr:glycosyltransferase [Pseudobutyrivibrio sp. OR37]SFI08596.1 Glycosyltransferase sugar-binding region containing DXD motif-containing protein [Pseudobutyrivibrio sp. OR37]
MVTLKNMGPVAFKNYIKDKEIVIFGAGRALDSCLDIYFENENVLFVVDNNDGLWNTEHEFNGKIYMIYSLNNLIKAYKTNKNLICYIDSPFYANEVVEQLDAIPELDELECYLSIIMRNTFEEIKPWEFTKGPQLIPKKIHYIWVGGKELPGEFKKNIESWRKYNPDYEIIRWDESNYDFCKDEYTKLAFTSRAWGFVPNLARLDIINKYGGIYLDTDVEAIANFDILLKDKSFFNMGSGEMVSRGCGFGSISNADIIQEMIDYICVSIRDTGGEFKKTQDHTFSHPVLKKYGFEIINQYQKKDEIVLYPREVMSPLTIEGMPNMITEKTVSLHKEVGSWKLVEEKKNTSFMRTLMNRVEKK